MSWALGAAGFSAALAGLAGAFVPVLIRRIPEPAAHAETVPAEPSTVPRHPDETAESVTGQRDEKELYSAIAGRRGLAWKTALAGAVAGGLVGASLGWTWSLTFLLFLVPVGVALAVVDWRTRLLPTRVIAPSYGVVSGLVLLCLAITRDTDDVLRAFWGWVVAGGLFLVLWLIHPRGMGYGDVRLAGLLGIALGQLGWGPLLVGVYSGFLIGGVGGGVLSVLGIVERREFAFGPFMLVGALGGIVFGSDLAAHLARGWT